MDLSSERVLELLLSLLLFFFVIPFLSVHAVGPL
jgi:hypothetical protein